MKLYDILHNIIRTHYYAVHTYTNITRIQDEIINHNSWYKNNMCYICNVGILPINYLCEIRFKIQMH